MMLYRSDCPLCRLWHDREITTKVHYEDAVIIIVDCLTCKIPMVVIKRHDGNATETEKAHIHNIVQGKWPGSTLRCTPRQISNHFHCHVAVQV